MRLTPPSAVRGVTLVELLVGISIVAILLGLGVPSISGYIQSARMNSAAQTYLAGVQEARTRAIRGNVQAEFILTDTPTNTITPQADNIVPSPNGQNWAVRAPDPDNPPNFLLVEAHSATEGSGSAQAPTVTIQGIAAPTAFTGTLAFNGFGGTADGGAYQFDIANPSGGLCALAGGPMRCPSIRVPAGGLARLCDPAAPAAPADSRGC